MRARTHKRDSDPTLKYALGTIGVVALYELFSSLDKDKRGLAIGGLIGAATLFSVKDL